MARKFKVKYGDEVRNFSKPEGHALARIVLVRRLAKEKGIQLDATQVLPHNREECACNICEKWRSSHLNPLTDLRGASRARGVGIPTRNLRVSCVRTPNELYTGRFPRS